MELIEINSLEDVIKVRQKLLRNEEVSEALLAAALAFTRRDRAAAVSRPTTAKGRKSAAIVDVDKFLEGLLPEEGV